MVRLPDEDFAAFIFDCDGTLVDSMPLHHQAWCAAFQEHGAPFEFDWELFTRRAGMGLRETVEALNRQFECALDPVAVAASQRAHYTRSIDNVRPIERVIAVVRRFAGSKPMAVASGNDRALVERALSQVGVVHLFDAILGRDDVERGKPHPDIFLRCADLMNVRPQQCLVFEDGASGIEAAKAAQMAWIDVTQSG